MAKEWSGKVLRCIGKENMNKIYYCSDCQRGFTEDEAGTYSEWEGEGFYRGKIYYMCCPYCGSDSLEDGEECEECGEYFPEAEIHKDADGRCYCEECMNKLKEEGEWESEWDDE